MKQENGFWVDENNNKWTTSLYTEDQAKALSKTLTNCTGCTNCTNCTNCTGCTDCRNCMYCRNCKGCTSCTDCWDCRNCTSCIGCRYCTDCWDCRNCTGCQKCTNCTGCTDCTDYSFNPNRYAQKALGSTWDNTCIYWDKEQTNIQVVCGCFKGSIEEFKGAVLKKYNRGHGYIKYINIALTIMEMERHDL